MLDGTNLTEVTLSLQVGAVISGRIKYSDDEPAVTTRLVLFHKQGQSVTPYELESAFTNDRGDYRIAGLPPGTYFVGVAEDKFTGRNLIERDDDSQPQLPAAYYPSASSVKEAKAITLTSGERVKNIDITLAENSLFAISGKVKWKVGRPLHGITAQIDRSDDPAPGDSYGNVMSRMPDGAGAESSLVQNLAFAATLADDGVRVTPEADGSWSLGQLPAGSYRLKITANLTTLLAQESEEAESETESDFSTFPAIVSKELEVTISDHDVTNVVVELTDGNNITGQVFDDEPRLGSGLVQITAVSTDNQGLINFPTYSKADGSFRLRGVPAGNIWLDLLAAPRSGRYIESAKLGNTDLLREPLPIQDGIDVTGIQIRLASDLAHLSGQVTATGGQSSPGAAVMIVPADTARWHFPSAPKFARTDLDGEFRVDLAPGDYLILTWPLTLGTSGSIESFITRHAAQAQRLTLGSNDEKQLSLPLLVTAP